MTRVECDHLEKGPKSDHLELWAKKGGYPPSPPPLPIRTWLLVEASPNSVFYVQDLMLEDEEVSVDDKSMIWFLQPRTALLHLRAPTLKYMQTSSAELPFWVRQNTRMKARNRFVDALGQVGLTLGVYLPRIPSCRPLNVL